MDDDVLECQECGDVIYRNLTPAQIQAIADAPENFILYCRLCTKELGY